MNLFIPKLIKSNETFLICYDQSHIAHYFMIVSILIIAKETVDGLAASSIKRGDNTDSHHLQAKPESQFVRFTKESAAKGAKESAESHR